VFDTAFTIYDGHFVFLGILFLFSWTLDFTILFSWAQVFKLESV